VILFVTTDRLHKMLAIKEPGEDPSGLITDVVDQIVGIRLLIASHPPPLGVEFCEGVLQEALRTKKAVRRTRVRAALMELHPTGRATGGAPEHPRRLLLCGARR
jgi:hypothetical protein